MHALLHEYIIAECRACRPSCRNRSHLTRLLLPLLPPAPSSPCLPAWSLPPRPRPLPSKFRASGPPSGKDEAALLPTSAPPKQPQEPQQDVVELGYAEGELAHKACCCCCCCAGVPAVDAARLKETGPGRDEGPAIALGWMDQAGGLGNGHGRNSQQRAGRSSTGCSEVADDLAGRPANAF